MVRKIGNIEYILSVKSVKNINMRITRDGEIHVSANRFVPIRSVDAFVLSKSEWILRTLYKLRNIRVPEISVSDEECLEYFNKIADVVYKIFEKEIPVKPPIKVKMLKSAWGICHTKRYYITLNKALYEKPKAAVRYVIIHEYVHLLYPNHQKKFYAKLEAVMPDYKEWERLLKERN